MKKLIFLAALALMAAIMAAPSYGQTPAPEPSGTIVVTPALQLDVMQAPVAPADYVLQPYFTFGYDALNVEAPVLFVDHSVVRMPMLKPEDAPMPLPLSGVRLWRPPVMNESVWKPQFTAATSTARPHNIRNAVFLSESRQATDNPALNL